MQPITVFGNSHAWFFTGRDETCGKRIADDVAVGDGPFSVHPLGPATAYSFSTKHLKEVQRILSKHDVPKQSRVIIVLGEVDCRWHIPKKVYGEGGDAWEEVCKVADRYAHGLRILAKDYQVIAMGVHPPVVEGHDPDYPRWGTLQNRRTITEMFNGRLSDVSGAFRAAFFNLYWYLRDKDPKDYYLDDIHLNQRIMPVVRGILKV